MPLILRPSLSKRPLAFFCEQAKIIDSLHIFAKGPTSWTMQGQTVCSRKLCAFSTTKTIFQDSGKATTPESFDTICELASSNLRFGRDSTREVGQDLKAMNAQKVIVVTDSKIVEQTSIMDVVMESLTENQIPSIVVYDQVRVEPNDVSFRHAIDFFSGQDGYDAVIAVGGGSVIDTAKAANLYATFPPPDQDFYYYVNPPLGRGSPIPATTNKALPPLIAIPTTAGTGSETTGVAIFDDTPTKSKTGIANRKLKPTLGIIDPNNTKSLPSLVATYSGLDVLCHAVESYTALPFTKRTKPVSSIHRPAYQGSNPVSDVWSLYALQTTAKYLVRASQAAADTRDNDDDDDEEARLHMLMASAAAGMGFGNAGVHLCHGMSYPISSQVQSYSPSSGYFKSKNDQHFHPLVPHGLSVIVSAPAVFRFTGIADPERHATCAQMLSIARQGLSSPPLSSKAPDDAGMWLAEEIKCLTRDLDVPMGLRTFGYTDDDIPNLVQGTLPQHRVTKLSPRPVGEKELDMLFREALDESYDTL